MDDILKFFGVMMSIALAGGLGYSAIAIGHAVSKRIRVGATPRISPGELDEVRDRLAELDQLQARVAELEERLDFAERLLARGKEPGSLV